MERLRSEYFRGYSNPQIFSLALEALEQQQMASNEVATDTNVDSIKNIFDAHEQRIKSIEARLETRKSLLENITSSQVVTTAESSYSKDERNIIITKIEQLKDKGLSFQAIADQLNAENIPTFSGKGKWHGKSVSRILVETQGD